LTCTIKILTPDGLRDAGYTVDSLADAVQFEPEGIYTITNTYNTTQVLKLDSHLDRMEDSARREGISLQLDRKRLRTALRQMILESGFGDVRFRVTVPHTQPDQYILSIEPFTPPSAALINTGVRCITAPGMMRRNPAAKTNDWAQNRDQFTLPIGIYEALLVNDAGEILEGFGSNFYGLLNGELRTAREGVLPGIAQQIIFTIAPEILTLRKDAIREADIPRLSEAFITSSSRGVIPVIEINQILIGDGKPGKSTSAIRQAYNAWVEQHLEEL
jgi:branched-chain amino acid aminotransferase